MLDYAPPVVFAALAWWLSTGAILFLIGLPRATFRWTALGATGLLALATMLVIALRNDTSVTAAYAGFAAGLMLWAWHEVMFLTGFLAGTTRKPCPEGLSPTGRFRAGVAVILHHELAIIAHGVLLVAISWGAANQFALWTFLILWIMRISAKLVVFSGAPNIADGFLPGHLDYLKSYFSRSRPGRIFVIAILGVTSLSVLLALTAFGYAPGTYESAGFLLLTAIVMLALIEHWALVLPVPDPSLWGWAIKPATRDSSLPNPRDDRKKR
jgi:putative photosynthetic complex assembly protein 2